MEAYVVEWLNLLVRWLHMIAGIAWIGSSFYFVWLDNHLQPPKQEADRDRGVGDSVVRPPLQHTACQRPASPVLVSPSLAGNGSPGLDGR